MELMSMKLVYHGDNLREPATLEISDDTKNVLQYLINMKKDDLKQTTYPPIINSRVWGYEIEHHKWNLYNIWIEYTIGHIGIWQRFVKHEYMIVRPL